MGLLCVCFFSLGKGVGLLYVKQFFTWERGGVAMCMGFFSLGKGVGLLCVCFFFHLGKGWGCYVCVFSLGKGVGLLCACFVFTGERVGLLCVRVFTGKRDGAALCDFSLGRKGWGCFV